jgi:hypothetical protein
MHKRLIISTPDSSRDNWKAIWRKLRSAGLEIHRYHARLTVDGMTIVADVMGEAIPDIDGTHVYQMPWEVV